VIDHVTIRVADLEASRRFYRRALELVDFPDPPTEGDLGSEWEDFSIAPERPEKPATRGLHLAFHVRSRDRVDAWWQALTQAGYRDDGPPGPRPEYSPSYYGAFVLDPDGNSAEAVHHDSVGERTGVLDHLWIRVADVAAARRFYETVAPFTGFALRRDRGDRAQFAGRGASFSVVAGPPTQNVHIAFAAGDDGTVDAFHRTATEAGYRDDGPPGERPVYHPGYYGAYVLDPDGNSVEVVNHNRG
jgi:catechol 2,3-dioxygenase-like lactoylglutathione lyase family enzyme